MSKEALEEIDKQIISWVEQLDALYEQRKKISVRISDIEERLSSLKQARRALAIEWKISGEEVPIPLKYTSAGVREAIHEVFREPEEELTVDQIVSRLRFKGYNFGDKNPRRVVNMALINDPVIEPNGKGGYFEILEEIPF